MPSKDYCSHSSRARSAPTRGRGRGALLVFLVLLAAMSWLSAGCGDVIINEESQTTRSSDGSLVGEVFVESNATTLVQQEGEIFLEPAGVAGPESFAGEQFAPAEATPTTFSMPTVTTAPAPTTTSPSSPAGVQAVASYMGDAPALYGGSRSKARCDKEGQLRFLEQNPGKAAAFCAALNSDPTLRWSGGTQVQPGQLRAYFDELTPVILARDTRVTNHGYRDGRPTARQSVLQAGQAVLIDSYGVPRVRCECGNPLIPPIPVRATPRYTGPRWPDFDPTIVIVVQQTTVIIDTLVLVDIYTGETFERPRGTTGAEDVSSDIPGQTAQTSQSTVTSGDTAPLPSPLAQASLRNGDYGSASVVPTLGPDHGASPGNPGIADSADGVTFTSTEASGQSNALINWVLGGDRQFREHGAIAFTLKVDRATFVAGELWGDNYGYDKFHNGQGTISAAAAVDAAGGRVLINWHSWHDNEWVQLEGASIDFDSWHRVAFVWGGASDFELWIDGQRAGATDLPSSMSLPWGSDDLGSATNFGLGSNHERGVNGYHSAAGVTFADVRIWNTAVSGAAASAW